MRKERCKNGKAAMIIIGAFLFYKELLKRD